jgi:hypothetical protein
MSKQVHGDPTIDDNMDKVNTWFKEKVFTNTKTFLNNLDRSRLEELERTIALLNVLLPMVRERIVIREKQSPNYKKNLVEAIRNDVLSLN